MDYGYVRVSSKDQNIDRQVIEMEKFGILKENIYIDKETGANFDRTNYKKLKDLLNKDDILIVKSIDRLGRDYNMIIDEWQDITKNIQCHIFVIDMPLLDTRKKINNDLVGDFISNIVLQILSFVAQNERENIKSRQAEGIAIAKAKGIHMGRPAYIPNQKYYEIVNQYSKGAISLSDALKKLKISKNTFFKYSKNIIKRKGHFGK